MSQNTTQSPVTYNSDAETRRITDYVYICVGLASLAINVAIFAVLISDKRLIRKSAFIFCVTVGHTIGAGHMITSSSYRQIYGSQIDTPATPWQCLGLFWTLFYTYEFQVVGLLMAMIGVERVAAICYAIWYRAHWSNRVSWSLALAAFPAALLATSWGFHRAYTSQAKITWRCFQGDFWGMAFVAACATVSSVGGTTGVLCTLVAMIRGRRHLDKVIGTSQTSDLMKKQMRMTRTMLSISILDFLLTVIPNTLLAIDQFEGGGKLSARYPFYTSIVYSINSALNAAVYLIFNRDFRDAAKRTVKKEASTGVVVPAVVVNGAKL